MGFFSRDIKNMDDLFVHTLRDIYYAEKQILKALPDMVETLGWRKERLFVEYWRLRAGS